MLKAIRRFATPLSLVFAISVTACAGGDNKDQLAEDTALNRDLELANRDTAAQPALADVPQTAEPAPASAAPAPKTTAPRTVTRTPTRTTTSPAPRTTSPGNVVTTTPGREPERRTAAIPAGTSVTLTSGSRICTNTNKVGDIFRATVANTVTAGGAVIPAGASATVEVTSLSRSDNANDPVRVGLRVRSITFGGRTYAVNASTTSANVERVRSTTASRDARKVATGAAIGAVVGQILGKDTKSTVIGGAVGAAAGAGAAAATANYEGCVPSGGTIQITLNESVEVVA